MGTADLQRLAGGEGADDVGDESVGGPVSTADYIASARGGQRNAMFGIERGMKKRIAIRAEDHFRAISAGDTGPPH